MQYTYQGDFLKRVRVEDLVCRRRWGLNARLHARLSSHAGNVVGQSYVPKTSFRENKLFRTYMWFHL